MDLLVEALTVSQHLAMFAGHCSSASGDLKSLICHATSQDHLIEGICKD